MKKRIAALQKEIKAMKSENMDTSSIEISLQILKKQYHSQLTPWDRVLLARDSERPSAMDYIGALFTDFIELHGDRSFGDDKSVVGGIALFMDMPVTVIGIQKGKTTEENIARNFGMPHPEGYRKALRLMRQAEKFKRPIITFVDTPGAYPGIGAEERGQGQAIAANLMEMMQLEVPIISIIIGEGGSGGALALAVGNKVWMMENAIYSILSPEGFAAILYKDAGKAPEIVEQMKITSDVLLQMGVVDEVISEGENGINEDFPAICDNIKQELLRSLRQYKTMRGKYIQRERYRRFRSFGKVDPLM